MMIGVFRIRLSLTTDRCSIHAKYHKNLNSVNEFGINDPLFMTNEGGNKSRQDETAFNAGHQRLKYPGYPISEFFKGLQWHISRGSGSQLAMTLSLLGETAMMVDGARVAGDTQAIESSEKISRALDVYAFPILDDLHQLTHIQQYNRYQAKNVQRGGIVRGVELNTEESHMLGWMLDQVGIAHNFGEGDICIPFSILETQMRQVAFASDVLHPNMLFKRAGRDHEGKSNTRRLMNEWAGEDVES